MSSVIDPRKWNNGHTCYSWKPYLYIEDLTPQILLDLGEMPTIYNLDDGDKYSRQQMAEKFVVDWRSRFAREKDPQKIQSLLKVARRAENVLTRNSMKERFGQGYFWALQKTIRTYELVAASTNKK